MLMITPQSLLENNFDETFLKSQKLQGIQKINSAGT
jgi:hypothetical protein